MHFKNNIMSGYLKKFSNKSSLKKLYRRFYSLDFDQGILVIKNSQEDNTENTKYIKFSQILSCEELNKCKYDLEYEMYTLSEQL
jgi:hypothetical protein